MLEGVVGALLLDSSYAAVEQLLRPWVASSYAAEVAEHQANSTAGGDPMQLSGDMQQQQQQQQQQQGAGQPPDPSTTQVQPDTALVLLLERIRAERRYWYEALRAALQRHQQQYRATQEGTRLAAQIAAQVATGLHQQCGGCSLSPGQLQQAGWLLLEQLELRPSEEGQRLQYLGHALLRLCVAVHVFEEGQAATDAAPAAAAILADLSGLQSSLDGGASSSCGSAWRTMHAMAAAAGDDEDCQHGKQQQQEPLAHADHLYNSICPLEYTTTSSGSNSTNSRQHRSSRSSGSDAPPPHVPTDAVSSDDDSCSTGSSSGSAVSLVQQLNKRFMCLHSMRFR
jgi:dsRNA-specific ribonuclease